MHKLHIANTFFEWELETQPLPSTTQSRELILRSSGQLLNALGYRCSLTEAFLQHPIFYQLQFLPVLYASVHEGILLCEPPLPNYWECLKMRGIKPPQPFTFSDISFSPFLEIESWGASRLIAEFANQCNLIYCMPEWKTIRLINSKQFSFECAPKLPHAALLSDTKQAWEWLDSFEGSKVLKTCYGVSAKGHLIIDSPSHPRDRIAAFLEGEWKKELPVIAEPWLPRLLDFSTQWFIGKDQRIDYLGHTICSNDARGQYRYNQVGDQNILFGSHLCFLKEHLKCVEPILAKIAQLGYFGNIGIDAMLYTLQSNLKTPLLHPVVEINARKTMGWTALAFQKRYFPDQILRLSFSNEREGYLPKDVALKTGKTLSFRKNVASETFS